MIEIKHYITGEVLYSTDAESLREAVEKAVESGTDLQEADLRGADLWGANLRGAEVDFSCLPLWCGSFGMKVDSRLIRQLAAHICRLVCEEPEGKAIQQLLWPVRNAFCRDRSDVKELEE